MGDLTVQGKDFSPRKCSNRCYQEHMFGKRQSKEIGSSDAYIGFEFGQAMGKF